MPPETPEIAPVVPLPSLAFLITEEAKQWEGRDASPRGLAPQEVSCAEGVSNILHRVLHEFPEGIVSTASLFGRLLEDTHFTPVLTPSPGCVIVSPRTQMTFGHAGIFIEDDVILSNDSKTGTMQQNYTFDTWIHEMKVRRGLHTYIFKPV